MLLVLKQQSKKKKKEQAKNLFVQNVDQKILSRNFLLSILLKMFSKVMENLAVAVPAEMSAISLAGRTKLEKAIVEIKITIAAAVDNY